MRLPRSKKICRNGLFSSASFLHPEHVRIVFTESDPVVYQVQIFSRIQFRHSAWLAPFPDFGMTVRKGKTARAIMIKRRIVNDSP